MRRRNPNYTFELKSNIRHYLTEFYEKQKEIKKAENKKYRWTDFYEEVAEFCGIAPSTISQIRLKNLQPSLITAIRISEFLNVEVSKLWAVIEKDEKEEKPKCIVEGCTRQATTKGYCMAHYSTHY